MEHLRFDFNNIFSFNVGTRHGVTEKQLLGMSPRIRKAHVHLREVISGPENRTALGLEWTRLPFQGRAAGCDLVLHLALEVVGNLFTLLAQQLLRLVDERVSVVAGLDFFLAALVLLAMAVGVLHHAIHFILG